MNRSCIVFVALVAVAIPAEAQVPKGTPILISNAAGGLPVTEACATPAISANGRFVAFLTNSFALTGVIANTQVVVLDRETGLYERASRSISGGAANAECEDVAISADGRYVVYSTRATNVATLELGFGDDDLDIYRFDRGFQTTSRVSVLSPSVHANADCDQFDLSDDGRFVVFRSKSTTLSPLADGTQDQIYLRDVALDMTTLVSTNASGLLANGPCFDPRVDDDGTRVVFASLASNLGDPQAPNPGINVWLRDTLKTGVRLISKPHHNSQVSNGNSHEPAISPDGRYIAFVSGATNLVKNDPQTSATQVYLFDVKNEKLTRLPIKLKGLDEHHFSDLDLSEGGKHLTFAADDELFAYRALGIYTRSTKATRMITADEDGELIYLGYHVEPTISANGKYAVFSSNSQAFAPDTDSQSDIFLYRR